MLQGAGCLNNASLCGQSQSALWEAVVTLVWCVGNGEVTGEG